MKINILPNRIKYSELQFVEQIKKFTKCFSLLKLQLQTTNYKLPTNKGFTLIEILVVFGIISILLGAGIGSYSAYNTQQQFFQTLNNSIVLVNQARSNSISTVKTINDSSGNPKNCVANSLIGYSVHEDAFTGRLSLYLLCESMAEQKIREVALPGSVIIGTPADGTTCTEVKYESLTAKVTSLPLPCDYVIKDGNGRQKSLHVDTGGNVSIQ